MSNKTFEKSVTDDPRIGFRNAEFVTTKKPISWVTGALLDTQRYPTPTLLFLDKDMHYFVALPPGVARITDEARTVLLALIGESDDKPTPVIPPVVEPSTGLANDPQRESVGTADEAPTEQTLENPSLASTSPESPNDDSKSSGKGSQK